MNVAIIGAGLAGLSCGIHLLKKGFAVKIFEKNDAPGGRASVIDEKGFKIDMGPTLVLMPEVLLNLFKTAGKDPKDYLNLQKLTPGYRINFGDGQHFDMTSDLPHLIEQVEHFVPGGEKAFCSYFKDVQDKFVYSRDLFIERTFKSLWDIMTVGSLKGFFKVKPFGRAYAHAYRYFKNDYLALAFSCQTLYLGESPFRAPALYNLLSYVEMMYGVWYPKGGLNQVPKALAKVFEELGGVIQLNTEVNSIVVEAGKAKGVRLKNGTVELADVVVSNRDLPASYYYFVREDERQHVPNTRIEKWHYGSSCVLFYLGLRRKLKGILHHNILLSSNVRQSADEIFIKGQIPTEPLLYVCSPTQTDSTLAPEGKEVVYILALAPNLRSKINWDTSIRGFRKKVFQRMKKACLEIKEEDIELEKVFTPPDFSSRYGSLFGNAFGLAPDFFQSACFRPFSKSTDVKGLYHVGASTHPGSGIPMVLTSGKLVAGQVAQQGTN